MSGVNALPVETAADLPAFCSKCGRRMVPEDRTVGFSPTTGTPILVAYEECRGGILERIFSGEPHAMFVVSPRPPVVPMPRTVLRAKPGSGDAT